MERTSSTYDTAVFDKATSPFAKRLQELVTNPSALKEYLGCSLQAINQYKMGTAFPKTENLIKIADFYGISVDFLLGRTEIPNMDTNIQAVHGLTGLSVGAIAKLSDLKNQNNQAFLNIISVLLEDKNTDFFLSLLCSIIGFGYTGKGDEIISQDVNGVSIALSNKRLANIALQTMIIENLPAIVERYKQQYPNNPDETLRKTNGGNNNGGNS